MISGANFIGGKRSADGTVLLNSVDAATGESIGVPFHEATAAELHEAALVAAASFSAFRTFAPSRRALLLDTIADEIDGLDEIFVEVVQRETAYSRQRIRSERYRTSGQLRMFATVLRRGDCVGARIDHGDPDCRPGPKSDIRQHRIGIGPVAILGSSSFPLALSTAGADTASALAAGCPVVFKAHPAHLMTSEIVAEAIGRAITRVGAPPGVFNMLHGTAIGTELVRHPLIRAVGFTGSQKVGRHLCDIAAARPMPIPVFAGMSSINPVIVLPDILARHSDAIAQDIFDSVTVGAGQFCSGPGLLIGIRSNAMSRFTKRLKTLFSQEWCRPMVSTELLSNFQDAFAAIQKHQGVTLIATSNGQHDLVRAHLLQVEAELATQPESIFHEEIFGPVAIVVEVSDRGELLAVLRALGGQLTASLIAESAELHAAGDIIAQLEEQVGRIVINALPNGIEVSDAIVHGGPWPATSDTRATAVGSLAIDRFLRPICYQNVPDFLLPDALKEDNPLNLNRLVDGRNRWAETQCWNLMNTARLTS